MYNDSPHFNKSKSGWIEVVCGCMFSGKTEELIRRLRRAEIAKQRVIVFKPKIDTRYSNENIVSHSETSLKSIPVSLVEEVIQLAKDADVVGIDEVQFFPHGIVQAVRQLADSGKRVIIAGLDMDYRGVPFEPVPQLLAIAEYITKTHAVCVVCGQSATMTQRKTHSQELVLVGASDSYEARCRECHYIPE